MVAIAQQSRRLRTVGALAALYLAAVGAVTWVWLRWYGVEPTPPITAVCALPAVLGAVLACTSTADERQYVARVLACMLFLPALLAFWAGSLDPDPGAVARPVWPFATGLMAIHALCFVGVIFWGGSTLTAVAPVAGVPIVSATDLRARLFSLNTASVPFEVANGSGNPDIVVSYRYDAAARRSHHVLLNLDAGRREVRVRERVGAAGARPISADEASMRGPGDLSYDPTRPKATHIWGKTAQTTQIETGRLAAVHLQFNGHAARLSPESAAGLDGEGMVTVLCALVTRSGWRWQPEFFASGRD